MTRCFGSIVAGVLSSGSISGVNGQVWVNDSLLAQNAATGVACVILQNAYVAVYRSSFIDNSAVALGLASLAGRVEACGFSGTGFAMREASWTGTVYFRSCRFAALALPNGAALTDGGLHVLGAAVSAPAMPCSASPSAAETEMESLRGTKTMTASPSALESGAETAAPSSSRGMHPYNCRRFVVRGFFRVLLAFCE